jgi:hypothetical protein
MTRPLDYPTWTEDLAVELRSLPITHLELVTKGRRHYCINHGTGDTSIRVAYLDSPSAIVSATEAKDGLVWWSAGLAADYLLDNIGKILASAERITEYGAGIFQTFDVELSTHKRKEWYTQARKRHDEIKKEAGTLGSRVHAYIESALHAIINGDEAPPLEGDIDERITAGVEAFRAWWSSSSFHPIGVEVPVAHTHLGYAGTIDVLAINANGEYVIVDWKTSKSLHGSYLRQIGAYSLAHHVMHSPDQVTSAYLVRLGKEGDDAGSFEAVHLDAWDLAEAEQAFVSSLALYRYTKHAEAMLNDHTRTIYPAIRKESAP